MLSMTYKPAAQWSVENRHDAAADQDILLSNVGGASIRFEITADDAIPELEAALGHTVQPGRSFALQMKAGERLYDTVRELRGHDLRANWGRFWRSRGPSPLCRFWRSAPRMVMARVRF